MIDVVQCPRLFCMNLNDDLELIDTLIISALVHLLPYLKNQ